MKGGLSFFVWCRRSVSITPSPEFCFRNHGPELMQKTSKYCSSPCSPLQVLHCSPLPKSSTDLRSCSSIQSSPRTATSHIESFPKTCADATNSFDFDKLQFRWSRVSIHFNTEFIILKATGPEVQQLSSRQTGRPFSS